jgi:aspartate aminotransferase-like enzyme
MPALLPNIDPDGLLEFSVVYTDRALNHMSKRFQGVMQDISDILKEVYAAHSVALVPGSGTFGMESVARQFAHGKKVMVIRNGWFSYRWTQIFEMGRNSRCLCCAQSKTAKSAYKIRMGTLPH